MSILRLLVALAVLLLVASARGKHVLLFVIDDVGYQDLGYVNGSGTVTPTMQSLVNSGILLEYVTLHDFFILLYFYFFLLLYFSPQENVYTTSVLANSYIHYDGKICVQNRRKILFFRRIATRAI